MTIHYLLWAIAAVLSLGLAFRSKAVREALLLNPVQPEQPVPTDASHLVRFKTVRLKDLSDKTTAKPRVLLALLLFVLFAFLLKLLWTRATGWDHYLSGVFLLMLLGIAVGGGYSNLVAMVLLVGVPYGVGRWMHWTPTTMGLVMGSVIGGNAGMFLFRNYVNVFKTKVLEIKYGKSQDSTALSSAAILYRRFYILSLAIIPLTLVQQLLSYLWPSMNVGPTSRFEGSLGQYSMLILSLGLGLNIVLFVIPLFREMLERTSLAVAADFTAYVVISHRQQQEKKVGTEEEAAELPGSSILRQETDEIERGILEEMTLRPDWVTGNAENRIKEHLGSDGQWLAFQQQQVFPILTAVVYLAVNTVGQTLGKFLQAGLITDVSTAQGPLLKLLISWAGGFAFWANLAFLAGLVAFWLRWIAVWLSQYSKEKVPEEEAQAKNTELLWEVSRQPGIQYYCYNQGSEPVLVVADPTTT